MAAVLDQIKERVEAVNMAIKVARKQWSGVARTPAEFILGVQGTSGQVLGAIKSIEKSKEKWEKRAESIEPSDQKKLNDWVKEGNEIVEKLHGIAQDGKQTTLSAIVADTAKATAKDTAKAVKVTASTVAAVAPTAFKLVLVVAIVVAIAYVVAAAKSAKAVAP